MSLMMMNKMNFIGGITSVAATSQAMSSSSSHDVEALFNKILSPIKKSADPNLVGQFCQLLNSDLDAAQLAIDLLIPKMQSSQEWEALISLYILEACVKNCGDRFHALIGRFRFLNEMIKLVSPKYLANKTSDKVKQKVIELLYCWSRGLPHETKITEAYQMLKRQNIVLEDPTYVEDLVINVPPRAKNPVFEDNIRSKELARLLQSKNPQDLEQANRLIKSMVKQEEIKCEKISSRINELVHINNNIKLLNDMLLHYDRNNASQSEKDTIKYLYDELETMRPNLDKLATETDDNDASIGEIIQTSEQCEKIINQYRKIVEGKSTSEQQRDTNLVNIDMDEATQRNTTRNDVDKDDSFFMNGSMTNSQPAKSTGTVDPLKELEDLFLAEPKLTTQSNYKPQQAFIGDLLGKSMMPISDTNKASTNSDLLSSYHSLNVNFDPLTPVVNNTKNHPSVQSANSAPTAVQNPKLKALNDLNELGRNLMEQNLMATTPTTVSSSQSGSELSSLASRMSLNEMQQQMKQDKQLKETIITKLQSIEKLADPTPATNSLNDVNVKLESIKPDLKVPAFSLYDSNQIKVVLYFAREPVITHVNVIVLSVTSLNGDHELTNFNFQTAVPKSMKVKLQPASRNNLPIYNPILPPSAITQIMLVSNPNKEQIKLKYKISFKLDNDIVMEDVKSLPMLGNS